MDYLRYYMRFATAAEREIAREANRRAGWPDWIEEAEVTAPMLSAR